MSAQDCETEESRDASTDDVSENDNLNNCNSENDNLNGNNSENDNLNGDNSDNDHSDDDSSNEEYIYRVEYEVDNGSDDDSKAKYDSSAEDSDVEVS